MNYSGEGFLKLTSTSSLSSSPEPWSFTAPALPPPVATATTYTTQLARACTAVPCSHCHCRALTEPQLHTLPCPGLLPTSPGSVQLPYFAVPWSSALVPFRSALPCHGVLFPLQLWCVPEVGPVFGLRLDSVP